MNDWKEEAVQTGYNSAMQVINAYEEAIQKNPDRYIEMLRKYYAEPAYNYWTQLYQCMPRQKNGEIRYTKDYLITYGEAETYRQYFKKRLGITL